MLELNFYDPIPKGLQVLVEIELAGLNHRLEAAWDFAQGSEQGITLEPEPDNPHDANAIKVIGWFLADGVYTSAHLGYVPKEAARTLTHHGFLVSVKQTRMRRIWVGDNPHYCAVRFQLLAEKPEAQRMKALYDKRLAARQRYDRRKDPPTEIQWTEDTPAPFEFSEDYERNPFDFS